MKVSDYVIDFLVSEGITHIFEVAGGALAHLLDSMFGRTDILTVSMHHEMAAAIAAEGYSRVNGNVGIAMATSGPGATNLITGIGSCFFDSIPCLFITGQVNTYEFKFDRPVRQVGFQETDIVNIVKPVVKDAVLVTDPDKIRYYLEKSVYIAMSERPGPVLLDIPLDIQRADINPGSLESFYKSSTAESVNGFDDVRVKQIVQVIRSSSRPVVLVGGGVRLSKAQDELLKFIHKTGIPVVTSLLGLDAFSHNDQSFVGMIGSYGNRYANLAIANSDLILALGTRLDTRQTGTKPETFARVAKIVHVDIDPYELNNKVKADFSINSDVKKFLAMLNKYIGEYDSNKIEPWRQIINRYKERYPSYKIPVNDIIEPNFFMHKLSEFLPEGAIICVDVGQIQMWAAQSLEVKGETIVVITGDGGFQLNIQELQTIYYYKLPIKILLLNNCCYGMVRQFQEQYFNCRFQSTVIGYSCPNFQDVVSAYKIPARKNIHNTEIAKALQKLFSDAQPMFLEVSINPNFKAFPKLSVNRPIEDQDPLLPRDELKSNMLIDILLEDEKE
jgi:acetolactate synthase-1/2/3 large subunit